MKGIQIEGKFLLIIKTKVMGIIFSVVACNKIHISYTSILLSYIYGKLTQSISSAAEMVQVFNTFYRVLQDNQVSLQKFSNLEN